uniref:VWFA domain-containing protein n=1 Tax=Timema monikensis TaxID=170555 RepID=A0A7R9E949_9NEOP|nr:unnamed protein product [Timema monikensis]
MTTPTSALGVGEPPVLKCMRDACQDAFGLHIGNVNVLLYAYDAVLMAENEGDLQNALNHLNVTTGRMDLCINTTPANILSFHAESKIQHRYAKTTVTSKVDNTNKMSTEIFFRLVLPESAFISQFQMEIDDKVYKANVKEKEKAKEEYNVAVSAGLYSALCLTHLARAVGLDPCSEQAAVHQGQCVAMPLFYMKIWKRGCYSYKTLRWAYFNHPWAFIDRGTTSLLVADLSVVIYIEEFSKIIDLHVPPLQETDEIQSQPTSQVNTLAKIEHPNPNEAVIHWAPTLEEQKSINKDGVKGQLIVRYDVDRLAHPEQILINDGYFVHFYAPNDLKTLRKHVTFVLDASGSMCGRKMEQLKAAMKTILSDLNPDDLLSIIIFSTGIQVWDLEKNYGEGDFIPQPIEISPDLALLENSEALHGSSVIVSASATNIEKAKHLMENTDINIPLWHFAFQRGSEQGFMSKVWLYVPNPWHCLQSQEYHMNLCCHGNPPVQMAGWSLTMLCMSLQICILTAGLHTLSSSVLSEMEDREEHPLFIIRIATNIYGALKKGIQVALFGKRLSESNSTAQQNPESMIIFLTDGQPNIEESNTDTIVNSITEANNITRVAIFSLAFGDDADMEFLKKLSLRNSGFARKIYEASDAALQLNQFYKQVSSPLLSNVTFKYQENQVVSDSLTRTNFHTLFDGSELIISGRLHANEITGELNARCYTGLICPRIVKPEIIPGHKRNFMERMWAFLTIQQLLDKITAEEDNASLKQKALELALKCKLAFCKTIADECQPFLQRFQTSKPMTPYLFEAVEKLLRYLMNRCVKPDLMKCTGPKLLSIDTKKSENLILSKNIDIGFATKRLLGETAITVTERQKLEFIHECRSMLTTMIAKLQEKSPLKQKAVRGLSSLDPCVIQHSPQLAQKRFSFLLEELNHANIINDVLAENAKKEYLHFCNLKKSELQEIFRPCDQFSDEVGLDTIYGSFLIGEANYKHLWEVIKICLVLSHGNATVEGGFSVNKSLLVENMHEKTVIAQRHIHDEIQEAGGIKNIHISKKMLDYVRGARKRYHEYLEMKKQEKSEKDKKKAEKRKLDIQVKDLEGERKKLMMATEEKREAIDVELQELKKKQASLY